MATKLNAISVPHHKNTHESETVTMPVPGKVTILMSQHMGAPCELMVQEGDQVKVGQIIADTTAFLSAPIHSSVSGTVENITEVKMPNGNSVAAAVIKSDGQQTLHESAAPPVFTDKEGFLAAVRSSGLVGLGGAGFPAHIKFNPAQQVTTLVVNAAECEPFISADYRTIMEDEQYLLDGIRYIMEYVGLSKCIIGVEDNKPAAIEKLKSLQADGRFTVMPLKSKYPKGAEKVLVYETTGQTVPEGKLPADVGVIVSNVTSVAVLGKYMKDGIPLVSKRLTVDGGAVTNPGNIRVPVGTAISDIIDFCGGYKGELKKLLRGGPMMGTAMYDDSFPIIKSDNAIIAFDAVQFEEYTESPCIRCGRCMRSCPMRLMPLRIEDCFNRDDVQGMRKHKVNLCVECGCCAYECPAKRNLVQTFRLAKARLARDR